MSAPSRPEPGRGPHLKPGSDLRDKFAIAVLPAVATKLLNTPKPLLNGTADHLDVGSVEQMAARISYMYADAMMAERERER